MARFSEAETIDFVKLCCFFKSLWNTTVIVYKRMMLVKVLAETQRMKWGKVT
jgi:hypothetical protein